MDAEIVTGGVSEFHCSLQSKAQYSTIPRSVDGEAVGVSEVVEGGSAFEYNKNCLREALCIILDGGVVLVVLHLDGLAGCWAWNYRNDWFLGRV